MSQHVLVVDDEMSFGNLVASFLERHEFSSTVVDSIPEAIDVLARTHVDLVLLDVIFPQGNSLDALVTFTEKYPSLPVILISGLGCGHSVVEDGVKKGAAGYITKLLPLDYGLGTILRALNPTNTRFMRRRLALGEVPKTGIKDN